jgi:hypothetical protein
MLPADKSSYRIKRVSIQELAVTEDEERKFDKVRHRPLH